MTKKENNVFKGDNIMCTSWFILSDWKSSWLNRVMNRPNVVFYFLLALYADIILSRRIFLVIQQQKVLGQGKKNSLII